MLVSAGLVMSHTEISHLQLHTLLHRPAHHTTRETLRTSLMTSLRAAAWLSGVASSTRY